METTYIGTFVLTDKQKRKLEETITSACHDKGNNYSAEIRVFPYYEMISIKVYPPKDNCYVSFHYCELEFIGKILGKPFAFCDLFPGGLELTFMK